MRVVAECESMKGATITGALYAFVRAPLLSDGRIGSVGSIGELQLVSDQEEPKQKSRAQKRNGGAEKNIGRRASRRSQANYSSIRSVSVQTAPIANT